jgi:DNA polymerase (family 10)
VQLPRQARAVVAGLQETAELLELAGENPFRARAYANASRTVLDLSGELEELVAGGRLASVKGIGKGLAADIVTLWEGGEPTVLADLRGRVPAGLKELMRVPGLGPKRIRMLYEKYGVVSLETLEEALTAGRLAGAPGLGGKTLERLAAGVAGVKANRGRVRADQGAALAADITADLAAAGVPEVIVAGALRRRCEVIDSVDLVALGEPRTVARAAAGLGLEARAGHLAGRTEDGLPVRVWLAAPGTRGAALLLATGPEEHVAALRNAGWHGGGESEEAIYEGLGMHPVPPEWRDRPGLQAPEEPLVERGQILGMLHVHTDWSDGMNTLREMAEGARDRGCTHVAICDHSRSAAYAGGLDERRVRAQADAIDALNADLTGVTVLKGTECDILADGSLDFPDELLASFDLIVASIHSRFELDAAQQTARLVRAVSNPHVSILGHPTGRLLLDRPGYQVDIDAVVSACREHGVAVEINASPWRLDLDWRNVLRLRAPGLRWAVNTDAHELAGLDDLEYGVGVARKAGLTPAEVINTLALDGLREWLRDRR